MILLSLISVILLSVVIRLWLACGDYQKVIDRQAKDLKKYDHWLRATSTWLDEEIGKREILVSKREKLVLNPCKN